MRVRKLAKFINKPLKIAVAIAAKDEELSIEGTIRSMIKAGAETSDIFVVNDGSSDFTELLVKQFSDINLISNKLNIGKAPSLKLAINEIIRRDKYNIVCLIDADTFVDVNYFYHVRSQFEYSEKTALVIGNVRNYRHCHNWLEAARALEYFVSNQIFRRALERINSIFLAPGCSISLRIDVAGQLTFDKSTYAEDMRMVIEVHRKKLGNISFAINAFVYTKDPITLSAYSKQIKRWYEGGWQVILLENIPFKLQRIDFAILFIYGEEMIWSLSLPFAIMSLYLLPEKYDLYLISTLVATQAFDLIIACFAAIKDKRYDILYFYPIISLSKFVNAYMFVKTFISIVILRKESSEWFQPSRI